MPVKSFLRTTTQKLSFALTILILFALIVIATATAETSGDWEYTDNGTYITIGRYTGNAATVTIPGTINEKPVTSIDYFAFWGCGSLTSVTIPNSVTSIGAPVFVECSNLTSVNVESANSYYSSENGILYDKNKSTILCYPGGRSGTFAIPNSVTSIGHSAFRDCSSLMSMTIPNSVTSIGYHAFLNCSSLTSVTILNSITFIGEGAFSGCSSLTSVNVESANGYYSSEDGALYDKSKSTILCYPGGKSGMFTIPSSVTSVSDYAFDGCSSLASITIPNSVTSIGYSAFSGCSNLKSVTIPNSVMFINNWAFGGCSNLTSITIPNSITSIGYWAFGGCSSLTSVTIPNSVTSIGMFAFSECNGLTSMTIPNSIMYIDKYAFYYCRSLYDVYFNSATPPEIGENVFGDVKAGARAIVPSGATAYGAEGSMWNGLIVTYGQPTALNASPTASTILINGKSTAFEAYNISGSNYFKLRDLAAALNGTAKQFEVGYDNSTKAIALTSAKPYVPVGGEMAKGDGKAKTATPTVSKIYLDGEELNLAVYLINGNNFFKLRDLMKAIDVFVGYDSQTKVITLDTSSGYIDE